MQAEQTLAIVMLVVIGVVAVGAAMNFLGETKTAMARRPRQPWDV